MPQPSNHSSLKTSIESLDATFRAFVAESAEYRERTEKEQSKIWNALTKQSEDLHAAVASISSRGEITWPKVVTTVLAMLAIGSAFAGVGHQFVNQGFERESIHRYYAEKERDRNSEILRKTNDWMLEQQKLQGTSEARLSAQEKLMQLRLNQ